MPARKTQTRTATKTHTTTEIVTNTAAPSTDAVHLSETLLEEAPHVGREAEYEAVVSYVARQWSHVANTALFVCGGCGCGKTSTVKRALRAMSARVLPCDAVGRSLIKRSSLEERGWKPVVQADMNESNKQQLPSCASTPRTSHQLSSDATGLTPSSSLSSALCNNSPFSVAAAVESASTTPAATRRGSQSLIENKSFLPSSPASGRPSASSVDSTASVFAAAGPVRGTYKRSREEEEAQEDREHAKADLPCGERRTELNGNRGLEEESCGSASRRTRPHEHLHHHSGHAATLPVALAPCNFEYFQMCYPEVFPEIGESSSTSPSCRTKTSRSLFGHYVNCADVSGPLLVEAICGSIRSTCTRQDSATHTLLQQLSHINGKTGGTAERRSGGSTSRCPFSAKPQNKTALHVVALDEVEYVRGGGAKTLAQLAELAFQLPGQLALIFISNQRAFVHVPQMMLEALLFEPYSEEQLRRIGADATAAELRRFEELSGSGGQGRRVTSQSLFAESRQKTSKAGVATLPLVSASDVDIKPRLYDYIARKALLEYSGDVRQVLAMCHRVVSVAWEEVTEATSKATLTPTAQDTPSTREGKITAGELRRCKALSNGKNTPTEASSLLSDLPAKLEAAVETYSVGGPHTRDRSSHRDAGNTNASSSTRSSAALPSPAGLSDTSPSSPTASNYLQAPTLPSAHSASSSSSSGVMTLAKSVRLLQSNQVESDIDRYVGMLPEQTLYVLSCIVVLTLRKQEERTQALTSVGGRMGTGHTPGAGVTAAHRTPPTLSLKLHEVHQLYTRLMAELHFPAMRADGFPLQVECLADFGVLTRPQLRGTDRIFSLNGTWTLPAMQQALVKRGEAIKQDRLAAGAEAVENKFEEVLRELSRLIKH